MDLDEAIRQRNKARKDLENIIIELVKECYRLQGKVVYEPLALRLEELIKGKG